MTEGFVPEEVPVRRGRRNPELRAAIEAGMVDEDMTREANEPEQAEAVWHYTGLMEGDMMAASISTQIRIGDDEAWVRVAAQTTVQPGEDSEDTFVRLGDEVNDKVIRLAIAHGESVMALAPPPEPEPAAGRIQRRR
jgi:hypothetical protein